jgi:PAS domain S-box-containing protein
MASESITQDSTSGHTQFLRIERTEAALHLSEATKTAILQTALDCIVTIDHRGFVVDWNPAAERTFGYSLAEAVGREMCDLIIPQRLRGMHRQGLTRAVTTGQDVLAGQRIEISALRKSGEEFPVELSITRIASGPTPLFTGHIRDISGRKLAERELRESQQLLSSITRNISDAIFRRSVTEGLVFVNEAYVKMFGYDTAEEVRQLPPEQFYADPERRPYIVSVLNRDGKIRNEEIEYRRKDGTTFWGLTSATGIRAEAGGEVIYFDGAIHDITERKQAEQRQAAQYAIVRVLAESASLAAAAPKILEAVCQSLHWDIGTMWQVETNEKKLRCVDVWHQVGLKLDAFLLATRDATFSRDVGLPGRIWKTAEPAWISDVTEDRNFPRAAIAIECGLHGAFGFPISLGKRVLGVIEFFSHRIRKPEAEVLEMFSAIGSQIGQFIERKRAEQGLRSLNKDLEGRVTERTAELVNANTALRESESRYRTVTEHAPAAIVVLDTQAGKFVEVNENAVRLFGMSREELLQVGPAEVSPPFQSDGRLSAQAARDKIGIALRGSTPAFEWIHRRADGTDIPCEVRVARLPAAGRELVIGAVTDITVRKKAEAELHSALVQERELSQLKSNFVNVVSHEFRTPLGVIMSSADILENYFDRLRAEQRAGHLQDIRHATHQMTGLMEEVLLLGRVDSGKMECRPEPLDLAGFCQRLVDEQLSATAGKCPILLKLKALSGKASGDEGVLRHIFNNLLSNAVKYSPAKSQVHFSLGREGPEAVFEVRDNGIGIPTDDQKRLYEAFHRGQNVGEIPGTGLGMVIVKRCVDLHQGTIEVASAAGRGTTFVVRLKLFSHAQNPSPKANRLPKTRKSPVKKRPKT